MIHRFLACGRLAGAALVLLGACAPSGSAPATGPAAAAVGLSVEELYARAMADAALYEERDVLPLRGVDAAEDGTVRVVTATPREWIQGEGDLGDDTWVTVVPEVRDSCAGWPEEDKRMRMRQLLGLQPTQPVEFVIEMEVPAAAMFRPAANPAIHTDTLCDTRADPDCALRFPAGVDSAHVAWIASWMLASWKMPNGYPAAGAGEFRRLGYPWTRLGYTYNWAPGAPRYGASEYVVRRGTHVVVTGTPTIAEYCRRT